MGPDPEQYEVSTGLERLITAQDPGNKGGIPVVKIIPDGLGQVDLQDAGDRPVHELQMDPVVLGKQSIPAMEAVVESGQGCLGGSSHSKGGLRQASHSKRSRASVMWRGEYVFEGIPFSSLPLLFSASELRSLSSRQRMPQISWMISSE
ncbi:hypothetical protein ACVWZJ_000706 [Thermostichus sp. OS-CIW-29]